jgi:endonuclease YncB( thermonuclease family)
MNRSLAVAAAAISLLWSSSAVAQLTLSGVARVKDGDSLMVGATEVRLYGIDAPELHQTCERAGQGWACGAEAKQQLAALVGDRRVECDQVGTDQYRRALARCRVGDTDINRTLVALGYAVAFRHYSLDYASAEDSAKANRRGLWSGTFEMPSEYRHLKVTPRAAPTRDRFVVRSSRRAWGQPASGACNIKGNRNRKGQWIYHLPGMPYYEQTRAEEMFCTEAQARAAGYRRAIVR